MKKTNKTRVEEFIRVDHAGERGAIKIYEGQLLALNTSIKNEELKALLLKAMMIQILMKCLKSDKDNKLRKKYWLKSREYLL